LFRRLKNKRLLAFIGSRLHPRFDSRENYVYRAGEEITTLIVVRKGIAAFVSPR
jgi:hypothetical protein